ncbi:AraC family transcriptional regulator [Mucilaginibacter sp. X5P1]|uniref:AraC family transcriptional regulator n=1 Tax=Mucilaginibacter sp. X5P1 TaxID=2723088 RepID=UPI00161A1CDE|nr:AraC family transcriptional regulator [Mucilaginibacter sp. X5P1]MBB6139920.1 AraC-like DNA-binding protein [Mucilaginibacter sp. X5P1]
MIQGGAKELQLILFACYPYTSREGENFIPEHSCNYIISGNADITIAGKTYHCKPGEFRFFRRNQLSKYVKYPQAGGEYKSISIRMNQDILHSVSTEHNLHVAGPYTGEDCVVLQPNDLLKNYMESLTPYLNGNSLSNDALTTLKIKEAIMILLQTHPELKNVLFDFTEPGKIDLEAYMNENYKFNVDVSRFAYLTGRSLATFKRDFERIYHTPPNRWLQQKRLDDAYYRIKEKGQRVTDVYMDVGFKDLSHFSFAFKKAYGITPSKLAL